MSPAEEIATLEAKLRARENRPGFAKNVEEIKARIAQLKEASE